MWICPNMAGTVKAEEANEPAFLLNSEGAQ